MKECKMKDQSVYLISQQEQRVAMPLLVAMEISERLEEFVSNLMKLRAVLKTSLRLLLELKSYPVYCSTLILQVVIKFGKAKITVDDLKYRNHNFLTSAQETAYWKNFLSPWLHASLTLLQVAEDLQIPSLKQVIHQIHGPTCTAILRPQTFDAEIEERKLLLSSRIRGRPQQVNEAEDEVESKFNNHCMPGFTIAERVGGFASSVLESITCHGITEEVETSFEDSSKMNVKSIMSLVELMKLETVVSDFERNTDVGSVGGGHNLNEVLRVSTRDFEAGMRSESTSSTDVQMKKTHKVSKSWSITTISHRTPNFKNALCLQERQGASMVARSGHLRFINPATEEEDGDEDRDSVTATSKADRESTGDGYTSLNIRKSKRLDALRGLKSAARIFGLRLAKTSCSNKSSTRVSQHLSNSIV